MTETRVLFNDSCPICSREIKHYARLTAKDGLAMSIDPLGKAEDWGIDADTAARQIHVMYKGQLLVGVPAFLAMWSEIPRYRWLARIIGAPVIRPVATVIYDRILAPILYGMHRRRAARKTLTQRQN